MNDSELQQNYYEACYHYAKTIGPDPIVNIYDPISDFVELTISISNVKSINLWNHSSTQPTNTQLKTYTVQQVQDSWNQYLKDNIATNPLNESGTILLTLSGPWASNQNINIGYIANKNVVTMNFPTLSIASDSSGGIIQATSAIKLLLRPNITTYFPIIVEDNGNKQFGTLELNSSGIIKIYADANRNNFSLNGGNYGFENTHISYCL